MNRFSAIIAAKNDTPATESTPEQNVDIDPVANPPGEQKKELKARNGAKSPSAQSTSNVPTKPQPPTEVKKRGRPNAKRSDPNIIQTTAYIRKETHRNVKRALLDDEQERDYSELVEELLAAWLKRL